MRLLATMPAMNSVARHMNRLQRELESAFNGSNSASYPALNIWEDDDHLHVESELPGYDHNDLDVSILGNDQLILKGSRKPIQHEKAIAHRQERTSGSFERTITLPIPVDGEKVQAKFTNGVLVLKIAKAASAKPKKIEIVIN